MVLQHDWAAIYLPRGQGSATLLTRPFLVCAWRGLGTRLYSVPLVQNIAGLSTPPCTVKLLCRMYIAKDLDQQVCILDYYDYIMHWINHTELIHSLWHVTMHLNCMHASNLYAIAASLFILLGELGIGFTGTKKSPAKNYSILILCSECTRIVPLLANLFIYEEKSLGYIDKIIILTLNNLNRRLATVHL